MRAHSFQVSFSLKIVTRDIICRDSSASRSDGWSNVPNFGTWGQFVLYWIVVSWKPEHALGSSQFRRELVRLYERSWGVVCTWRVFGMPTVMRMRKADFFLILLMCPYNMHRRIHKRYLPIFEGQSPHWVVYNSEGSLSDYYERSRGVRLYIQYLPVEWIWNTHMEHGFSQP
jgi:hypothetical protein